MLRYYRLNGHVKEIKNSGEYSEANLIKMVDPQYEDIYRISKKEKIIHAVNCRLIFFMIATVPWGSASKMNAALGGHLGR